MDRNVRVILNNKEVYGFQGQKILDLCAECGVEIPTLCYDDHKVEDIDTAGEDHIYDETRYFLMSRPIAPRLLKPAKKKPVWNPLD